MTEVIEETMQKPEPGELVTLFHLDLTPCGSSDQLYFVKRGNYGTGECVFDGVTYTQLDIEAKGFKWDGSGTFARPTLAVSTVSGILTPYLVQYGFLIGAKLTATTTFSRYLDGGVDADPTETFPPEEYRIKQLLQANSVFASWSLATVIDETNAMLPGRVMLRDVCPFKYRVRKGSTWVYFTGECPYNGTSYFDENDNATTISNDVCSRRLSGCEARFGDKQPLPFGGFPGISSRQSF